VPTGFFHVPFDCLPIGTDTLLVDRAAVSLHSSLTSALALMRIEQSGALVPSIAIYDQDRLKYARRELDALSASIREVKSLRRADQFTAELAHGVEKRISLLAMAVHGSDDETGWGQTKLMPDGSTITAARVLGLDIPRLCVLASCYSSITTADGIELGGFPLALMLRGATTVIGGLYQIADESTADIMVRFWRRIADGQPPLPALRSAKLDWIGEDRGRRKRPRGWAGLVVYGSAAS
jgi:CHAT domain-containing protein